MLRVYGDFMGTFVPEGTHTVVFDFEPSSVTTGLRVSLVGLGLLPILYWVVARFDSGTRRKTV